MEFNEDSTSITAMKSRDGEVVSLQSPVGVTPDVEVWLSALTREMRRTLSHLLVKCVECSEGKGRRLNPAEYPSQVRN